jgi:hypothetical protein
MSSVVEYACVIESSLLLGIEINCVSLLVYQKTSLFCLCIFVITF